MKDRHWTRCSTLTDEAFAKGLGLEPEKVLIQTEFAEPHRAYATLEDREEAQTRILSIAIKEFIKREISGLEKSSDLASSAVRDQRVF